MQSQEILIQPLCQEDPLEKEMVPHSSILAWKIPWTEEPGRLQSMGLQRVRHHWVTSLFLFFFRFFSLIDYYRIRIKLLLLHPRLFPTLIIILCSVSFDPISGLYLFAYFFRALNIMQTLSGPQLYKKISKILLIYPLLFPIIREVYILFWPPKTLKLYRLSNSEKRNQLWIILQHLTSV